VELTAVELWERIRAAARDSVPEHAYSSWLSGVVALALTDDELVLEAGNRFKAEWLEDKYGDLLEARGTDILRRRLKVTVRCSTSPDAFAPPAVHVESPVHTSAPHAGQAGPAPAWASPHAPVSFDEARSSQPSLNDRYTFERFVVGTNNQLATAAAGAAADRPGRLYNPLVFYGGVGLGKTHLMHAIGHRVLRNRPDARVAYVSSEQFMNEMITAIQRGNTAQFRARYRQMDVLLVDDVQFLKGKESTQDEFFHTFNALYDSHRQIVLTGDRPPQEMEGVEERLVSRFEWGLAVDLRPPDLETRIAILRRKAEDEGLMLEPDVIECIAHACTTSVRELEGAVIKLLAVSSVWNTDITPDFARRVLDLRRRERELRQPQTSPERIKEETAQAWRVRSDALAAKTRTRTVTEARHVAMYAMRHVLELPLTEIGDRFGGRDHSTVLYSIRKVENRMEEDREFRGRVSELIKALTGSDPETMVH
jgi:chromosomal replication initiator protein